MDTEERDEDTLLQKKKIRKKNEKRKKNRKKGKHNGYGKQTLRPVRVPLNPA